MVTLELSDAEAAAVVEACRFASSHWRTDARKRLDGSRAVIMSQADHAETVAHKLEAPKAHAPELSPEHHEVTT